MASSLKENLHEWGAGIGGFLGLGVGAVQTDHWLGALVGLALGAWLGWWAGKVVWIGLLIAATMLVMVVRVGVGSAARQVAVEVITETAASELEVPVADPEATPPMRGVPEAAPWISPSMLPIVVDPEAAAHRWLFETRDNLTPPETQERRPATAWLVERSSTDRPTTQHKVSGKRPVRFENSCEGDRILGFGTEVLYDAGPRPRLVRSYESVHYLPAGASFTTTVDVQEDGAFVWDAFPPELEVTEQQTFYATPLGLEVTEEEYQQNFSGGIRLARRSGPLDLAWQTKFHTLKMDADGTRVVPLKCCKYYSPCPT